MQRRSKVTALAEALARVQDGDTIVLGGCFSHNKPMAAVRELVRQGRRGLEVVASPAGCIDLDLLVGSGVARRLRAAYVGFEHLGLAPHFRRAAEAGTLALWECDEAHLFAALEAAARLVPLGVTRAGLGSDLPRLNPDLRIFPDPFSGTPVVAVPALQAQGAILHVQQADSYGNCCFGGSPFADLLVAQAVKRQGGWVVVTADAVVESAAWDLRRTGIPHILVDAVVCAPFGAHPCSSHGRYAADEAHLRQYLQAARSEPSWQAYMDTYVTGCPDHWTYLERIGSAVLQQLGAEIDA